MTDIPDIMFAGASPLRKRLESLSSEAISLGPIDAEDLLPNDDGPHVLVLATSEAQAVWTGVEERALDAPIFPLLVGRPEEVPVDAPPLLKLAPILESPTNDSILREAGHLLLRYGKLYRDLQIVDASVQALAQNAACEWVRCSIGVVGLVRVDRNTSMSDLADQLEALRLASHATVDRIPPELVSTDDLWTLLLIVAVPWSRADLTKSDSNSTVLTKFTNDTRGSRKVVVTDDELVHSLVGPIVGAGGSWHPSSDDPLRDQLRRVAQSAEELQALDVLFKKRFPSEDIDRLITTLGKKS